MLGLRNIQPHYFVLIIKTGTAWPRVFCVLLIIFYPSFAWAPFLHLKVLADLAGSHPFCKHSFHEVINLFFLKKRNGISAISVTVNTRRGCTVLLRMEYYWHSCYNYAKARIFLWVCKSHSNYSFTLCGLNYCGPLWGAQKSFTESLLQPLR